MSTTKADEYGATMTVSKSLQETRLMAVEFAAARISADRQDEDVARGFGSATARLPQRRGPSLDEAPTGACVLYALSCNSSDWNFSNHLDFLSRPSRISFDKLEDDRMDDGGADSGFGSWAGKIRLQPWTWRKAARPSHGEPGGWLIPQIDRAQRPTHFRSADDEGRVNGHIDGHGLERDGLFARPQQAPIEDASAGSEERAILELPYTQIAVCAGVAPPRQTVTRLETP